jgi:hypothetical protein
MVPQTPLAQPSRVCAIRLTEVPVKEGIDDGIFLKDNGRPIDNAMIFKPPAPPCPLPGK